MARDVDSWVKDTSKAAWAAVFPIIREKNMTKLKANNEVRISLLKPAIITPFSVTSSENDRIIFLFFAGMIKLI